MSAGPTAGNVVAPEPAQSRDADSTESDDKVAIPRHLGLMGCIWHTVGSVIGTGIFITPAGVLEGAGGSVGVALIMWVAVGLFQTIGCFVYVELALMFKKSGGELAFLFEGCHPVIAFLRIWMRIFIECADLAIVAIVIPQYLLTPFFHACAGPPMLAVRFLGISIVLFFAAMNCLSVKNPTRFAGVFTVSKLFGLAVIIVTGLYNITQGHTAHLESAFTAGSPRILLIPIAYYSAMYAYGGWDIAAALTEEVKNPERDIPLCMTISMTIITTVYILTNVAYFTLLSPEQVLHSSAVAADYSVFALGHWSWLIWVFVALSAMGSLNSSFFRRGREYFVLARDGLLPEIVSMLNIRYLTPIPAIVLNLIGLVYLIEVDIISIIRYAGFVYGIFQLLTVAIVPYYRWKYPNRERKIKLHLVLVIIFMIGQFGIAVISMYLDPVNKSIGIAVVLSGLPIYLLCIHPRTRLRQERLHAWTVAATRFLQKLCNCVHQEKKTF